MTGRWYGHDPKLDKAFAEGHAGVPSSNPHASGSDAYTAYAAGATQAGTGTPCSPYGGVAACSAGGDPPLLTVDETDPADDEIDVAIDDFIEITFSHDLNGDSLAHATITLEDDAIHPAAVAITMSLDTSPNILIITPDDDLDNDTEYTLTISGVVSADKGPLAEDVVISFTTVAET